MRLRLTSAGQIVIFAIAVMLTIAMVSDTYAWQSISQTVTNEADAVVNPGGRLHDDFNGANKDIYVENFTDAEDDGEPIYVRIKLSEYMEIGDDAGVNFDSDTRDVSSVSKGAKAGDKSTWPVHYKSSDSQKTAAISDYWQWFEGGSTVYMPTFNKNKDSLRADNNGTLIGDDGYYPSDEKDSGDMFVNYFEYSVGAKKSSYEIYDNDYNSNDELTERQTNQIINASSSDDAKMIADLYKDNISVAKYNSSTDSYEKVEHISKETLSAVVISMAQWKAEGSKPGPYWVYDTDGWVYWAQALQPGTATGLLLDRIDLKKNIYEHWYYAIDVDAQFITADDSGYDENTGFWKDKDEIPSEDAKLLLKKAGVQIDEE